MGQALSDNTRARLKRSAVALVLLVVLSVLIEVGISWGLIVSAAKHSTSQMLDQVETILVSDTQDEVAQTQDLKDTYISYAKAVSYILDADSEAIENREELEDIADLMGIDEIHIFDDTGTIYAGTVPDYYGYSFDSGEQMGYFKPMLSDKTMSMCQDVTPNTAEGKSMMYAIAWDADGEIMVQVGVEPKRLLAALEKHELSNVIGGIPLPEGMSIYAVDPDTSEVTASTYTDAVGAQAADLFGNLLQGDEGSRIVRNANGFYYCAFKQIEGNKVVVAYDFNASASGLVVPAVIVSLYMLIAAIVLYVLLRRLFVADEEKTLRAAELAEAHKAAEAANDAKTSFLFNMSHDIRTPMNAIIGFTDLMRKHDDDAEKRHDYLRKIQDSSIVLLNIINNVLDMARIEKGAVQFDEKAWSAEQFNDSLVSVFADMMDEKGITFVREMNVEHGYVYCDATKLTQIFNNILSNAYKYTNPGGRVEMKLEEQPCEREGYVLYQTTIADTGIGMDADYLPHLFEEFSRERSSTETRIQGTGLGMPIVKRLVELLDGTIEVESEKGVGTTFIVTVPHRIADKSDLTTAGDFEFDPGLFEGRRILLAEDNDLNAEIAMEILGEAGFAVDRAEDGTVCVSMLAEAPMDKYDVVLMDIQMPCMNGYEAACAIREMGDTAKARIPILAMTANAFEEDKQKALRAGMDGHIAKPINVPELMKALAEALS